MGTLRGDDGGGGWPPGGGGLPGLPPEWGEIIIPDDASALDAEATALRRHFRREARRRRWRRRLHLPAAAPRPIDDDRSSMQTPLLIMAIAIIAALASLFTIDWSGTDRAPSLKTSAGATLNGLLAVTLYNPQGTAIRLGDTVPAVVLLVEDCSCASLVEQTLTTVASTDPRVAVVEVTASMPTQPRPAKAPNARLYTLVDGKHTIRSAIPSIGTDSPSAVLLAADGTVVQVVPMVHAVDDFSAGLPKLTA